MSLNRRVCLVTGAAGFIGQAIIERLGKAGAQIVAVDLYKSPNNLVDWYICDLGDLNAIAELEVYIKHKYGKLDVLINNAAVGGKREPVHHKPLDEYEAIERVNIRAPFLLMQAALRLHLAQHQSDYLVIINVTSIAATRPEPLASLYSMSRAALLNMSLCVAKEYGRQHVRCVAVSPGTMETPNIQGFDAERLKSMFADIPIGRGGRPLEVAHTVCWLASAEAIYVNGVEIKGCIQPSAGDHFELTSIVDGGAHCSI